MHLQIPSLLLVHNSLSSIEIYFFHRSFMKFHILQYFFDETGDSNNFSPFENSIQSHSITAVNRFYSIILKWTDCILQVRLQLILYFPP